MMNRFFLESLMDSRAKLAARVKGLTTDVCLDGGQPGASEIHKAQVNGAKGHLADLDVLLDRYWETHNSQAQRAAEGGSDVADCSASAEGEE